MNGFGPPNDEGEGLCPHCGCDLMPLGFGVFHKPSCPARPPAGPTLEEQIAAQQAKCIDCGGTKFKCPTPLKCARFGCYGRRR